MSKASQEYVQFNEIKKILQNSSAPWNESMRMTALNNIAKQSLMPELANGFSSLDSLKPTIKAIKPVMENYNHAASMIAQSGLTSNIWKNFQTELTVSLGAVNFGAIAQAKSTMNDIVKALGPIQPPFVASLKTDMPSFYHSQLRLILDNIKQTSNESTEALGNRYQPAGKRRVTPKLRHTKYHLVNSNHRSYPSDIKRNESKITYNGTHDNTKAQEALPSSHLFSIEKMSKTQILESTAAIVTILGYLGFTPQYIGEVIAHIFQYIFTNFPTH